MKRPPPRSTLFPYTTLFRSAHESGSSLRNRLSRLGELSDLEEILGLAQELWPDRSEEHTSELQSRRELVCRLLLEKKKREFPSGRRHRRSPRARSRPSAYPR